MQKQSLYTMEDLVPVMQDFFAEGKKVVINAVGNSMSPLIRHKKDAIVLTAYKGEPLVAGQVVLYKRNDIKYALHRIVDVQEDGSFVLLGDNQTVKEIGIKPEQIIAVPTAIIRGEKSIDVNSKAYVFYTKLWTKSIFFRKLHIKFFEFRIWVSKEVKRIIK